MACARLKLTSATGPRSLHLQTFMYELNWCMWLHVTQNHFYCQPQVLRLLLKPKSTEWLAEAITAQEQALINPLVHGATNTVNSTSGFRCTNGLTLCLKVAYFVTVNPTGITSTNSTTDSQRFKHLPSRQDSKGRIDHNRSWVVPD